MKIRVEALVGGLAAAALIGWIVGRAAHDVTGEARGGPSGGSTPISENVGAQPVHAAANPAPQTVRTAPTRAVVVNGEAISDQDVRALEATYRVKVLSGRYWYDRMTGAWGYEGGPAVGLILAGLNLGGRLASNASNGNTGVFINGRQLHILDVRGLMQIVAVQRGRYWMDALGNFGYEGRPLVLGNIVALANAAGGRVQRQGILSTYDKVGAVVIGGQ